MAAGLSPAARTELLAWAGTVLDWLLLSPLSPGENALTSHSPSPLPWRPSRGGAPCVLGTRGLDARLSGSRCGFAALSGRTRPVGWTVKLGPDSEQHTLPTRVPLITGLRATCPGHWDEWEGRGFPSSPPPPPGRILVGAQLPAGLAMWVFLPAPLPILFSLPSFHRSRNDLGFGPCPVPMRPERAKVQRLQGRIEAAFWLLSELFPFLRHCSIPGGHSYHLLLRVELLSGP